jgi:Arc/MetJ family transcription regulator
VTFPPLRSGCRAAAPWPDESRGSAPSFAEAWTRSGSVRVRPTLAYVPGLALHITMCRLRRMPTNLAIDDDLLVEAQKVGGHRTKKDTVNEALREYIQRRRQRKVLELFGQIDYDSTYDYKKQRRRS